MDGVEVAVSAAPRSFKLSRRKTAKKRRYVSVEPARMYRDAFVLRLKPALRCSQSL